MEKRFKGTEIPYDDGIYVTYVNADVDDGSDVAKLMDYFKTANPEDMSQGDLSARIHFFKCEEGGYPEMCEVSEKILPVRLQFNDLSACHLWQCRRGVELATHSQMSKTRMRKQTQERVSAGCANVGVRLDAPWIVQPHR